MPGNKQPRQSLSGCRTVRVLYSRRTYPSVDNRRNFGNRNGIVATAAAEEAEVMLIVFFSSFLHFVFAFLAVCYETGTEDKDAFYESLELSLAE